MKKQFFQIFTLVLGVMMTVSCRNESVEHIGATRLVIMQPIPMAEKRFDENFTAILDLLYPHQCHDTAFIQEQVFLERIDLATPYRKEFIIPPKLWRDFFGSNNPDTKKAQREDMFYLNDTAFEKNPDQQFLTASQVTSEKQPKIIVDYLARNRKNALVYLFSIDTLCRTYMIGGSVKEVHNDLAKLNCRIVGDLRLIPKEELEHTTVILLMIPPAAADTLQNYQAETKKIVDPGTHRTAKAINTGVPGKNSNCPPDSVVERTNKARSAIINEFRNLLHYIATTNDEDLKRKYRDDAGRQLHLIPDITVEGIPGSLNEFLYSGFSKNVKVSQVTNNCKQITGIIISDH